MSFKLLSDCVFRYMAKQTPEFIIVSATSVEKLFFNNINCVIYNITFSNLKV